MKTKKKILAIGIVLAALVGLSLILAGEGVSQSMRKYDIFRMVAEDLEVARETNAVMDDIKVNAAALSEKLDLTAETNRLLEQQIGLVDEFNSAVDEQPPMMDEAIALLEQAKAETERSLDMTMQLYPIMDQIDAEMAESLALAQQLAGGMDAAVAIAAGINGQLDQALAYTIRISRQSKKMNAFMGGNPTDLASLQAYVPQQSAPTGPSNTGGGTQPAPVAPEQIIDAIGKGLPQVTQELGGALGNALGGLLGGK
jgi:hypothetical protein